MMTNIGRTFSTFVVLQHWQSSGKILWLRVLFFCLVSTTTVFSFCSHPIARRSVTRILTSSRRSSSCYAENKQQSATIRTQHQPSLNNNSTTIKQQQQRNHQTLVGVSDTFSLSKDGEESESLMESLSRVAGFMQQQQEILADIRSSSNTDEKGKTKTNDDDNTIREEEEDKEDEEEEDLISNNLNEDQKRDLDKSITRFSSAAEAKIGMDLLSPASLVIRATAPRLKVPTNNNNNGRKYDTDTSTANSAISTNTRGATGSKRKLLKKWSEKVLHPIIITQSRSSSSKKNNNNNNVAVVHGGRISRDIRDVAVSVASNVDNLEQWRLFCDEGGGLQSIFQSLRVSARLISVADSGETYTVNDVEDAFNTSSMACRALRDLCALSPELSAVITEDILDASSSKSFFEDENNLITDNNNRKKDVPGGIVASLVSLLNFSIKESAKEQSSLAQVAKSCRLYVIQMVLAMALASDAAVYTIRATPGLVDSIVKCSSYAKYKAPILSKLFFRKSTTMKMDRSQLINPVPGTLDGTLRMAANQVLAAIGHNIWVPKQRGQKGLRILCLDGGGTRGIAAVTILRRIVKATGGVEVCDAFDIIAGTSTGAIISFLVALRRESSGMARKRYNMLIKRIFVKSPLSTPMLIFTTASYDESHFMEVMNEILGDNSMLGSRANPDVPFVFAVSSKMSSTPTQVCLFRNYNYSGGELPDTFVIDPIKARAEVGLTGARDQTWSAASLVNRQLLKTQAASRHPGSFRIPQKVALRATTAAPTVFKPVLMGGELYCDGGMLASNPSAIAIHEARSLFPDVPIELVVSLGTGAFVEEKNSPRIGWDGIITQIVNSATDAEQPHHILEDILGQGGTARLGRSNVSKTRYYRFNPLIGGPNDFPLDGTDPQVLEDLCKITDDYLSEETQERKLQEISNIIRRQRSGFLKMQ